MTDGLGAAEGSPVTSAQWRKRPWRLRWRAAAGQCLWWGWPPCAWWPAEGRRERGAWRLWGWAARWAWASWPGSSALWGNKNVDKIIPLQEFRWIVCSFCACLYQLSFQFPAFLFCPLEETRFSTVKIQQFSYMESTILLPRDFVSFGGALIF